MRWRHIASAVAMLMNSLLLVSSQKPLSDEEQEKIVAIFGTPSPDMSSYNELDSPCTTEDGKQGVCVLNYQCNTTHNITDGANLMDLRKTTECDYLYVCCLTELVATTTPEPALKDQRPPQCGYSNPGAMSRKPMNTVLVKDEDDGTMAQFGEYPWMVAVLSISQSGTQLTEDDYIGGGSIIHPKVVLTCAHKVYNDLPKEIKCRAGEWDTQTDKELYRHQERNVKRITKHKHFILGGVINDVALLFLETPFEISSDTPHMGIACIGQALPTPGTKCETMGWGNENLNTLKKVELPLVNRDLCQERLRATGRLEQKSGMQFHLHESFICAGGQEGIDTCLGDGGSSLVCRIEDGGNLTRYAIFGAVAWSVGCKDGVPAVYVNVPAFRQWIVKEVQAELGVDPSVFDY